MFNFQMNPRWWEYGLNSPYNPNFQLSRSQYGYFNTKYKFSGIFISTPISDPLLQVKENGNLYSKVVWINHI